MTRILVLALLLSTAGAHAQTTPEAGARPSMGGDTGPAAQPPTTAGAQTQNRGTDGSVAGMTQPGATGASPQGMLSTSTAGSREPDRPVGGAPPPSQGVAPRN